MNWALRTSNAILADNARQSTETARLRGSLEAFLPTVSWSHERVLDGKIQYQPDTSANNIAFYGFDTNPVRDANIYSLQASLPLFDGFKRYNEYQSARSNYDAGAHLQIDKRQQVLADAASAHLAVIRDRKIVELRRKQVADISTIARHVKAKLSVHDATVTDMSLAESRISAAQTLLEQSEAQLASSEIEYTRIVGAAPDALAKVQAPDALMPANIEELQEAIIRKNPRLAALRFNAEAARHLADAAKADLLPKVDLAASRSEQVGVSALQNRVRDTTVKLQIKVPILQPGAWSRTSETSAIATQKFQESIDNERQIVASATALFVTRHSTMAQIARATERVKAMRRAVDGYRIEQMAGFRTTMDILNARSELTDAEIARVQLEFNRDKATYSIAAALAQLGVSPQVAENR